MAPKRISVEKWPIIWRVVAPACGSYDQESEEEARRLTPEEVAELRCCNLPREGDLKRRAGIEEMRQRLRGRYSGCS